MGDGFGHPLSLTWWVSCGSAKEAQASRRRKIMIYSPHDEGQGLVEYALIIMLVAIVVIVIAAVLGPTIGNMYSRLMTNL